jgi:type I restriction enzyme S subunit
MTFNELDVPEGWNVFTVEQLIEEGIIEKPLDGNHGGIHPKSKDYVDDGIPFVMASDMENGGIDFIGCKKITLQQAKTLRKGFAKAGDVLLSHKATIGRTAILQTNSFEHVLLTPQVTYYRVIDFQKLNPIYLKTYFDSPKFQSLFKLWSGDGSTRAYLGITAQQKLPIVLPPIDVQKNISSVIASFNEKINTNIAMNTTLEKIAQRIFKSWFVDFDPVKANAEGVPFDGLSPEIQALFPNEFEESELGMIPKGWEVKSLDEIASFLNGLACQKHWPKEGETPLPVIKIAEMRAGYQEKTNQASPSVNPKYIVNDGDFLFSWSGSLTTCFWSHGPGVLNQHLFKVTSDDYPQWFFSMCVNIHLAEFIRIAADKATTMGHIKREHLSQAKVAVPDLEQLMLKGNDIFGPLLERSNLCLTQTKTLMKARDKLLPRLISGKITIQKAEEMFEEAS